MAVKNNQTTNKLLGMPTVPLLPPPRQKRKYTNADIRLYVRFIVGSVTFFVVFIVTNNEYFQQNPLFGIPAFAQLLFASISGIFGFYVIPVLFLEVRAWFEELVTETIAEIVSNFWLQQSKKIHEAQKVKQDKKALEQEKKQLDEDKKKQDLLVQGVLVDTSVLIDGRLLDIIKTGFFDKTLIVPQSVLDELHLISDNKETLKRSKGRRGLDIVKALKAKTRVYIMNESEKGIAADTDLVQLAKKHKLKVMTLDFNLNKLAQASGVRVLNINDLVNAVKAVMVPGEIIKTKIIHTGKEKEQGVGYLDDGTMIVVEGAKALVGQAVDAKVTRIIQGPAGKMFFCKLVQPSEEPQA